MADSFLFSDKRQDMSIRDFEVRIIFRLAKILQNMPMYLNLHSLYARLPNLPK